MKIILISGKAQEGKDTTATIIKSKLEAKGKKVLVAHYGDLVKYVCTTFFGWNGEKDEEGRTLLQRVGTDVIRTQRPDYWVDFVKSILEMFPNEWDYVLIPDTRFPNEIKSFQRDGWDNLTIRVSRLNFTSPLTQEQQKHISETALDFYLHWDFWIASESGLDSIEKEVDKIIGLI